jgi:hypothetical protein
MKLNEQLLSGKQQTTSKEQNWSFDVASNTDVFQNVNIRTRILGAECHSIKTQFFAFTRQAIKM